LLSNVNTDPDPDGNEDDGVWQVHR
jgi:hypothetical protein